MDPGVAPRAIEEAKHYGDMTEMDRQISALIDMFCPALTLQRLAMMLMIRYLANAIALDLSCDGESPGLVGRQVPERASALHPFRVVPLAGQF